MDLPQDEVRRELDDARRAHDEALPVMAGALDRAFDPDGGVPAAERALLLGVERRKLFRIGGLTVAASALLAACVEQPRETPVIPQAGTLPTTTTTERPQFAGSAETDRVLVLTALSVERLAVAVYQSAIDNAWIEDSQYVEVATTFQGQHSDHADLLVTTARSLGLNPTDEPNAVLQTEVVDPATQAIGGMEGAERQAATIELAIELENVAAQTYAETAGVFTTPELRQAALSIGAVEARHLAVYNVVLGKPPAPFPLLPTLKAVPESAYISAS